MWEQGVRTGKAPRNPAGKPGAKLGSYLLHFSTLPARVSLLGFSPHVTDYTSLQYTGNLVILKHAGRDAERVFRRRKLELEFGLTLTGRRNGEPCETRGLLSVVDSGCDAYVYTDVRHRVLFSVIICLLGDLVRAPYITRSCLECGNMQGMVLI